MKMLSYDTVVKLHDRVITSAETQGLALDKSLEGVIHRINTNVDYKSVNCVFQISALYAMCISKGHAFNDANKRTAVFSMIYFLHSNNAIFDIDFKWIEEMIVELVEEKTDYEKVGAILKEAWKSQENNNMTDKDKLKVMNNIDKTTRVMTSFHNKLSKSMHFPSFDDVTPEVMNKQLNELIKLTDSSLEILNKWKDKI